ncbi:DUF3140 domain-containing protein [Marinitenerispora sediminis]|uniref:DUF3140 domain-containing protein n=1 Tax=Marinitenerispora sediminis TaxID=1931232 RepID=A0A368T0T0_9ACTN|nr:DUF3140 domain-containing protein [Marinitenerispora sediminis]RCV49997.1 hypothetical protein DEF23_22800 [Marinitenerispora sediminis]RCV51301.1 hypothetical protein DEF28_15800 [Marinitenerispora sediminis]RCV53204.1 hypothetical protein DEF24_20950 [Marinitenerispora sediminis]
MAPDGRLDPATEELWQEFHRLVNMRGDELRTWLVTDASGEDVLGPDPDLDLAWQGRRVVRLLTRRRADLTQQDVRDMREVVRQVRALLDRPRVEDPRWRHALMRLGHDPLQPDSPRPDEERG